MPPLPVLSGRAIAKAFSLLGWQIVRQSGSHMIMTKNNSIVTLSIPDHQEVARGTLRSLIRSANLTVDEFIAVL
jgi:predicted RNA binding protein YcfA (HicA-like mRNA interferase family)